MKRISLVVVAFVSMLGNCCGMTFEPAGFRNMLRGLGIGYGQGYHSKPVLPNLRPHYQRVTKSQPWKIIPPPTYPGTPFAFTTVHSSAPSSLLGISHLQGPAAPGAYGNLQSTDPQQGNDFRPYEPYQESNGPSSESPLEIPKDQRDSNGAYGFKQQNPWQPTGPPPARPLPAPDNRWQQNPPESSAPPATPNPILETRPFIPRQESNPPAIPDHKTIREENPGPESSILAPVPETSRRPTLDQITEDDAPHVPGCSVPQNEPELARPQPDAPGVDDILDEEVQLEPIPLQPMPMLSRPDAGLPPQDSFAGEPVPTPALSPAEPAGVSPAYPGFQSGQPEASSPTPDSRTATGPRTTKVPRMPPATTRRPPFQRSYGNARAWW